MKYLFNLNKWLVLATLLLYLTIIYGMLFQIVLGGMQVLMSIFILIKYEHLSKEVKPLFITYLILTASILTIIFSGIVKYEGYVLVYFVIPMLIAFFHLYITYEIKNHENSNS